MTKKQALKAVVFLAVFLWLLVTVTYIIRTNGDVKDRFTGFYAEKENTIDAILVQMHEPSVAASATVCPYPVCIPLQKSSFPSSPHFPAASGFQEKKTKQYC